MSAVSFLDRAYSAKQLEGFVDLNVLPSRHFINECHDDLEELAEFFQQLSFVDAAHVVGSYAKGTEVDERSDLDVIAYCNGFNTIHDFQAALPNLLDELWDRIVEWRQDRCYARIDRETAHSLVVTMRAGDNQHNVKVDILPAFDLLNRERRQNIYREMNYTQPADREYYGPSLDQLQISFVCDRIADCEGLRRLILLAKYWKKTSFQDAAVATHKHYPASYLLELLCIHVWERAGAPHNFSLLVALKAVLTQLVQYDCIDAHWTTYYNCDHFSRSATRLEGKPYILDPANPFNNACQKCNTWSEVADIARASCRRQLLGGVKVSAAWRCHLH